MSVEKAKELGVCCALVGSATCGRPLKKGQCRVHGKKIYASFRAHHQPQDGTK